jgi:hypothetical protein
MIGMHSRRKKALVAFGSALFALAFLIHGCGGGGDEGGGGGGGFPPTFTNVRLEDLSGNWLGAFQENNGFIMPHTVSFQLDNAGNLTQMVVDGTPIAVTAAVTEVSDQVFRFANLDSTFIGTIVVDNVASHIGFVAALSDNSVALMDNNVVGVVERGAAGFPVYDGADVIGSWSGPGVAVDDDYNQVEKWELRVAVDAALGVSMSESSGGSATGDIFLDIGGGGFGTYIGSGIDEEGLGFTFGALMSPDKTFVAVWESVTTSLFPRESSFSFLTKQ